MDFKSISTTATATATAAATINTPDTDTELLPTSDPKSSAFRSLSYNNGPLLKPHHHHHPLPPPQKAVSYKECLKNHAASLGGHALDGCGEFFPSPISNPSDPTSLKCAACGCHRNFHRRDVPDEPRAPTRHHRLLLPPPAAQHSMSPSPSRSTSPGPSTTLSPHSPPPVSHVPPSFFGTPTQMLLALSSAAYTTAAPPSDEKLRNPTAGNIGRKRSRTKFSQEQKDKMFCFAEKLGWRMQRSEDKVVEDFCDEIGIGRNVFKVWMHNNKHHMVKRKQMLLSSAGLINDGGDAGGGASFDSNAEENNNNNNDNVNVIINSPNESSREDHHHHQRFYLSNNGSSSSS
ncbi:hypothetical protein ACLB2K_033847 [Fragaria x ananassa]